MPQLPVVLGVRPGQHPDVTQFAISEARRRCTGVRAVHVRSDPRLDDTAFASLREAVLADPDLSVELCGRDGDIVDTLMQEADLGSVLVVGADDAPWIDRALGREVARELTTRVTGPMVVVPRTSVSPDAHRRVTVVVENEHDTDALVLFGLEAAAVRGEPLDVVHVAGATCDYPARQRHWIRLDGVIDRWRPLFPDVKVTTWVDPGHLSSTCALAGRRSSLLVLAQAKEMHARVLRRAIAGRLLQRSSAPVAVIPTAADRVEVGR